MKLAAKDIKSFLAKPAQTCRFFLLYGPDAGLASERCQQLAKNLMGEEALHDPLQYVTVSIDKLKDDPAWLSDELNAYSFFGGKKLIRILDAGAAMPDAIASVIEQAVENYVIVIAGELPATSSLRKAFEKEPFAVAIPCYREEIRDISAFTRNYIRENGYQIDEHALQFLCQSFYGDHLLLKAELDKLLLYCGEEKHIAYHHITASIAGMVELNIQDICLDIASGKGQKAQHESEKLLQEGMPAIAMLRSMINHFNKLYDMRAEMAESGKSAQQMVDSHRPPLFFKVKPVYQQHLTRWTLPKLSQILELLQQVEGDCKKTGAMNDLLLSRILLKIGKMA